MQDTALPLVRDLVLIGGGHTHALVLRMWAMKPLPGVRLTLINPDPIAPYTGMLPGLIAGHYQRAEMMIDLVRLARFANARLILDRATDLNLTAKTIQLANRPPLPYDLASIDIGITSDLPDLPGFAQYAHSAKPLGAYAKAWAAFVAQALPSPRLVIIGGGAGGVELALASSHRLRQAGASPHITLVDRGPTLLPSLSANSRAHLSAALTAHNITVLTNASPASAAQGEVTLQDGRTLPSDFTLTVAGARPHPWLATTGLALHTGYITSDAFLRTSDPNIFTSGDCAHLTHAPRPKAGVYAVRAAPILLANLRAALTEQPFRPFNPQKDHLKLIALGDKTALTDKWGLGFGGPWLWRIKDRIDRIFMAKFQDFPAMPQPALPPHPVTGLTEAIGDKPLCGGCGAKVGTESLSAMVASLPPPQRPEVLAGAGDDAAVLRTPTGVQVLTTDHLRAFTCDPALMARLTAIHALGDICAMGAQPQVALAQITLPRLSTTLQSRMLAEIMASAAEVFAAAGADIVGGHTSQGAELTIGFTVTGLTQNPITKANAQPGDALILTKAIGSGTILAAEMAMARLPDQMLPGLLTNPTPTHRLPAGKHLGQRPAPRHLPDMLLTDRILADRMHLGQTPPALILPDLMLGELVTACFAQMQRPQALASRILTPHAHAMTDVTGFGLGGHLLEMLQASQTTAHLYLPNIPLMPGAEALTAVGHHSSLAPANRLALIGRISGDNLATPRAALLYDPQTCGGLLAAVPQSIASDLIAQLHAAGDVNAAIIGHITAGPPEIILTERP